MLVYRYGVAPMFIHERVAFFMPAAAVEARESLFLSPAYERGNACNGECQ